MVFSSIPAYLDPANWQQQPNHHHHHHHLLSGSSNNNNINVNNNSSQLHHPLPTPPCSNSGGGGNGPGGSGSIRPGSMADRARMANIPLPEPALKCPRCESTNTKFCYFNNYSLTQPRHFCKTCRRYWTRGGALRNVPVGGGCRRNKRSSSKGGSSRSKSPASSSDRPTGSVSSSDHQAIPSNSSTGATVDMIAAGLSPQIPPLRFMNPFADHHFAPSDNLGLNFGPSYGGDLGFQIGSGLGGGGITSTPTGSLFEQQWRFQQQTPSFPFLSGGLDPSPSGLFDSNGVELSGYNNQVRPRLLSSGCTVGVSSQIAPVVKTEDPHHQNHQQQQQHQQEMNLSRQLLGIQGGNNNSQYWMNGGGNGNGNGNGTSTTAWTDLSGFSSTTTNTTNHPL